MTGLYLVLTNVAVYLHKNAADWAPERIPLDEIAKIRVADIYTVMRGPQYKALHITSTRESSVSITVVSVENILEFVALIHAAKGDLTSLTASQPHPSNPPPYKESSDRPPPYSETTPLSQ